MPMCPKARRGGSGAIDGHGVGYEAEKWALMMRGLAVKPTGARPALSRDDDRPIGGGMA